MLAGGLLLLWFTVGFWNWIKPLPPGMHSASLVARLAESQVDFIHDSPQHHEILAREISAVDRADQLIVLDQCPLPRELAQHILARKRARPKLKIVLVTDPLNEIYGGTPAHYFVTLEKAGVIVARTRLDRLRDSNPLYSGLWRLGAGWWSDPYDEAPGEVTLITWLRRLNAKANARQVLVADDGSGGWTSIVMSGDAAAQGHPAGGAALELRARVARDIVSSELKIADWSVDDDRLPRAPLPESRGVGSIDARFLTEGAIRSALLDAIGSAVTGDEVDVVVAALGDRRLIATLLGAAARRVRVRLLLDPGVAANRAMAFDLLRRARTGGGIEVRWLNARQLPLQSRFTYVRHGADLWLNLGSADYTRRAWDDFNLTANVELHMPARVAAAQAAGEYFDSLWSGAGVYATHTDESRGAYLRYRLAEATGLMND